MPLRRLEFKRECGQHGRQHKSETARKASMRMPLRLDRTEAMEYEDARAAARTAGGACGIFAAVSASGPSRHDRKSIEAAFPQLAEVTLIILTNV